MFLTVLLFLQVAAGLGLVLFRALDFGMDEDEERHLSPELTRVIQNMTAAGKSPFVYYVFPFSLSTKADSNVNKE